MAETPKNPDDGKEAGIVRYVSQEALNQIIDDKVDLAVAEYLHSLDIPSVWEAIKKHDKILLGNGRPGLIEEMAVTTPMVAKLDDHLSAFHEFEVQTKVDRQQFYSRFDQIEKKVDTGITSLQASIAPLSGLYDKMTKGAVAIGFFMFLAGGLLIFMLENAHKIAEFFKWTAK
jgi:hypothetical protein